MSKCYYCGTIGCEFCRKKVSVSEKSDTIPSPSAAPNSKTDSVKKTKKIKSYGFYSQKAVNLGYPTYTYRHVDGSTVEVSWTDSDPDVKKAQANWDDTEYLGEVTELI